MRKKTDPAKEELRQLKRNLKDCRKRSGQSAKDLKAARKSYKHRKVEIRTGRSYAAHRGIVLSMLTGVGTMAALIGSRILEKRAEAELAGEPVTRTEVEEAPKGDAE